MQHCHRHVWRERKKGYGPRLQYRVELKSVRCNGQPTRVYKRHRCNKRTSSQDVSVAGGFAGVDESPPIVIFAIFPSASSISTSMFCPASMGVSSVTSSELALSVSKCIFSTSHFAPSSQPAFSASARGERPAAFLISMRSNPGPPGNWTSFFMHSN